MLHKCNIANTRYFGQEVRNIKFGHWTLQKELLSDCVATTVLLDPHLKSCSYDGYY